MRFKKYFFILRKIKSMTHVVCSPQPGTNGKRGVLAPGVERGAVGQGFRPGQGLWTTPATAAAARPRGGRLGSFQADKPPSRALDWEPRALAPEHGLATNAGVPPHLTPARSPAPERPWVPETLLPLVGTCLRLPYLSCKVDGAVTTLAARTECLLRV